MVYRSSAPELGADELDAVFGALAHPARRAVLREITGRRQPPAMTDLAATLDMSPQLLNKHLATLERARLISRERNGRETNARPRPEVLDAAKKWIVEMTDYWNAQLDSLQQYIDTLGQADRPAPDPEPDPEQD